MKVGVAGKVLMGSVAIAVTLGTCSSLVLASTSAGHPAGMGVWNGSLISDLAADLNLSENTLLSDFQAGQTVSQIAAAQNVATATLISELESTLDSKLASGIDTQVTNLVNGTKTASSTSHHGGTGAFAMAGNLLSEAAADLNTTTSALQTDMKNGQTIAQIAAAQNVSTSTLISELESTLDSKLSQEVSNGKLTSAQETKLKSAIDTSITNLVNGTKPMQSSNPSQKAMPKGMHGFAWGFGGATGAKSAAKSGATAGTNSIMSDLATDLNISVATLQSDMKAGETVSQIAAAQNVPTSTLISELESTLTTQEEAQVATAVTNFVNSTTPPKVGNGQHGPKQMTQNNTARGSTRATKK